jgi:excisionase family DNA binding protein
MINTKEESDMEKTIQSNLLTREQAAQFLNLKKTTLEAWAVRGGGPDFVKMGKAVRYRMSDLETFIESRIRANTSEA